MNFASDNVTGAHPRILEALATVNAGPAMPYGDDPATRGLTKTFSEVFETEVAVFPVATGSAANSLALATLTPPWGAVYCHSVSHINSDECGAPEFFTGGAKLIDLPGVNAKLDASALREAIAAAGAGVVHHVQPACVSITQSTELGTVYRPDEIAALAEVAHASGLKLHMDGARFANAVTALDASPAELSWKAGVDVLSFGATKNGCLGAEAVVWFGEAPGDFIYRRKRAGHLFSKLRFVSAQLGAYLEDGLWLANARHANAMARRLAAGLAEVPGLRADGPVEANALFPWMPAEVFSALLGEGFVFYPWARKESEIQARLVTAFDTRQADVDALIDTARRLAGA